MGFIKIFNNPRKSMQRLGFLKYLVWQASLAPNNNLENLGNRLKNEVTRKISIEDSKPIQEYYKKILRKESFSDNQKENVSNTNKNQRNMEIQDYFLSDPEIPSHRGHLGMDDWTRYPYLATNLGLVNENNLSVKSRGLVFLNIVPIEEKKAFRDSPRDFINNPFKLSQKQNFFLLYCFIENDGDVLKKLYPKILNSSQNFDDPKYYSEKEAGDLIPDIYKEIAKEFSKKKKLPQDQIVINKILETAKKIEFLKNTSGGGGKNAREHAITYRLEAFVDFGLIKKPDPYEYRYEQNKRLAEFFQMMNNFKSVDEFITTSFFTSILDLYSIKLQPVHDEEMIMAQIKSAYNSIKNEIGYALINDIAILASINGINDNSGFLEIKETSDFLMDQYKKRPNLMRFQIDRQGHIKFIKFL